VGERLSAAEAAIEEIREVRRKISERFDNDPVRLCAHFRERHAELVKQGWPEAPPRADRSSSEA
jgi:hypothetical protein